ncbi:hypothetical protein [Seonamhaeicola aphaedonensis]|nr:hypothetical protein [Seonamhaeicola aphaedonensis]
MLLQFTTYIDEEDYQKLQMKLGDTKNKFRLPFGIKNQIPF